MGLPDLGMPLWAGALVLLVVAPMLVRLYDERLQRQLAARTVAVVGNREKKAATKTETTSTEAASGRNGQMAPH